MTAVASAPVAITPGRGRSVARLVLTRFAHAILVLWGSVTITFVVLHLSRGSVVDAIVGNNTQVTPAVRAEIMRDYGLGRPVWQQYLGYLGHLVRGDLGRSYQLGTPVATAIGAQLPATAGLMASATVLAVAATVVVGLITAHAPGWIRTPFALLEIVGVAIPQFWLAIVLLTVFSFGLHWFPVFAGGPAGLVLPTIALALPLFGILSQILRDGLERALEQPFALTARARGLRESGVLLRHALRHAIPPVMTLLGLLLGSMIGGAVIVEQVFSRPGVGQLLLTAVSGKDIPVVLGGVTVTAAFYVTVNLAVDLLYPVVDPRLRE